MEAKLTALGAPTTDASIGASARRTDIQHDLNSQTRLLQNALQSDKVRIGFFIGAGCPLGIYDELGKTSLNLIPDVLGLSNHVRQELNDIDNERTKALAAAWDELAIACKEGGEDTPTVEHILSELRILAARRGMTPVGGLTKDILDNLDAEVCEIIANVMSNPLPNHRCSYHRLASWVGGLERAAPVELFTTNYDLLIEQAFERQRIPQFDGFVGSHEPFFDITSIEQDAIPRRWTRLWKLHGSINWERRADGTVFRAQSKAKKGRTMIYPSHLKYDQSRRMPYLAMIDRLRAFFRIDNHKHGFGPPVLVVCGYSFSDDHLNEVLLDGLQGNAGAQCFVMAYGQLGNLGSLAKIAREQPNMTVLARDGAIIGTRPAAYSKSRMNDKQDPWIVKEETIDAVIGNAQTESTESVRCRLGDFHYFGLFLEHLYGGKRDNENDASLG